MHDATFGIMPSSNAPLAMSRVELADVGAGDQRVVVAEVAVEAGHVGEVHELLGLERLGDRAGDGVGVDVVALAVGVDADRGDDRDELLAEQPLRGSTGRCARTSPTKPRRGSRCLDR